MILVAALRSPTGTLFPGLRHADIVREVILATQSVPDAAWSWGFVTTDGEFIDRAAAVGVARSAGQLPSDLKVSHLQSEHIY